MNLVFVDLAREALPSWIEGAGLAIAGAQVVIYGIGRGGSLLALAGDGQIRPAPGSRN